MRIPGNIPNLIKMRPSLQSKFSGILDVKVNNCCRVEWIVAWNGNVMCAALEKLHSDGVYKYVKRM